jgi:hypothetical protein
MAKLVKGGDIMADNDIDFGDVKSKDIGNLITKTLYEIGKDAVDRGAPEDVDYGDLPSRALPEIGKQEVASLIKQKGTT